MPKTGVGVNDYPRAVYRLVPDDEIGPGGPDVADPKNYKIVDTPAAFEVAMAEGWLCHPLKSVHDESVPKPSLAQKVKNAFRK